MVLTFTGVLVHDFSVSVDDILGRPELVVVGVPGREIIILRHGYLMPKRLIAPSTLLVDFSKGNSGE